MALIVTIPPVNPSTGLTSTGVRPITDGEKAIVEESTWDSVLGSVGDFLSDTASAVSTGARQRVGQLVDKYITNNGAQSYVDSTGDPFYQPIGGNGNTAKPSASTTPLLLIGGLGIGLIAISLLKK